ncbi:RHS repeat-associated core domain-containing protein [Confluentibacter flavum]|uniref:Bacterial toxin 23 domain-containing protein n=1 Tax=Confluentibacter flavum TaxID=1909700 RepID=A0A2N3HJR2_9FLAO|nr:RHS repeat-associated core domain-containing protein [Confluentibacter flavum]PKQ45187.1 hypothetical protein CSW08_09215 [Confluentibacter flavum]
MKQFYFAFLFLGFSLFTNAQTPTGSSAEVGITDGQLSVSLSGAATYVIPIVVPPGINGVTPQISLTYNSQGGNGMAGYGWNIGGVSKITRIASTKYHDGTIDPVDFDNLDRFALDGQRLMVKTGTYGANGAIYETENFSNIKITSYGVHPSGAAYGPAYFLVEYPDGSKAYYGNSTDSISIMEYGVTYWENPQGLRVNYTYLLTNNVLNIATIGYGSQNTTPSINFAKFIYKTRLRPEQYYIGGQSFINDKILDQIQIYSLGPLYRTYQLAYNSNPLGYERLISVTEKAGGSSISYNPTVFAYEDTPDSMSYTTITANLNVGNITSLNTGTISGDFSGDEKMEFILYPTTGTSSKAKYWLFSNSNSNIGYEHNVGAFESIFPITLLSSDNKLMPKQGWTVAKKTDTNYTFTIYSADPVYTVLEQYNRMVNFPIQPSGSSCYANKIIPKNILSGDFNGDGLTDVIAIDNTCSSKKVYFVDLKRDNTANFLTYSGELSAVITASSKVEVADVNGDGKSDFMVFENGKVTSYTLNDANQLVLLWNYSDTNISIDSSKTILLGDYNGDAKTDFIIPSGYGSNNWYKYTSTGTGFIKTEIYHGLDYRQNNSTNTYSYMASDYDKDGKSDLIEIKSNRNTGNTAGSLTITSYKNINGIFNGAYYITASSPYVADINLNSLPIYLPTGKGITSKDKPYNPALEIAFLGNNKIFYFNSNKDNTKEQLLKSITTGNGVKESITYKPLNTDSNENNNTIYSPSGSTENYPNTDIQSASSVHVVTKLEKQSAADYKKQLFSYYGAVSNVQGLGFLGFRATMRTNWHDDSNPIISSVAKNDINLRGANIENYTALGYASPSSNTPTTFITKSVLTYESQLLANKVFKLKNTMAKQYNGLDNTSSETTTTYDSYNNPTASTTYLKNGGTTQQTTVNNVGYNNQPSGTTYYIGRPISKTTSVTAFGDTMTSEELYTYTNNLLTQIKKKGHNTNYITEDNIYDGLGNIIQKTITAGSNPRTTYYKYETMMPYYGRFLTESTDVEGFKTAYEYNLMNGTLSFKNKQTELNSWNNAIKTSYAYDTWGKKTKTTDYLGKSNTYSYTRSNEKSKTTVTGDDGSYSEELYDDLGRKLTASVKDLNGNISSVSYLYDIYGRNIKVSEPYSGGSPSQWNETKYDVYGRPTQNISFTGKTTNISYSGLTTTVNDGTKTKITTKNAIGNVVSLTDTPGGTITYTYFANGNLKSSNYDGVTTTIEQDGWGRKTKLTDPSAGTYTYTYNDFGEVLTETSPNGTTTYTLNAIGKLTQKKITGTNTNSTTTYVYNSTTKLLTSSTFLDALESNATTTTNYTYDSSKRLASSVETTPYATFTKQFTYDAFGRVNTETSIASAVGKTSSKTILHTYKNGSHWQLKDNTTQQVLWQTNTINARGQLLTANLGNGIAITNSYDTYGFLTSFKHDKTSTGVNIMILGTAFDAQKGNLTFRYNSLFNWNEPFTYDALDRLTSYKDGSGSVVTQAYDGRGRITQNDLGTYNYTNTAKAYQNTSITATPGALTHYQAYPTQNISYNAFKSPYQIEEVGKDKIGFTYNDNNSRSTMFYGGLQTNKLQRQYRKHYSADGSMEIKHNILTGAVEFVTYIGGNGYSAPVIIKSDGTTQNYLYLHRDYQGSILAITDAAGAVVEKRLFDAWGSLINYYSASGAPFGGWGAFDRGYTGHEHLQSVGLIHMNGRLYDPKLHRFLQTDNYVQDPGNTQNYNRYGYVLNNPLKYTDPSGWLTEAEKAQRDEEERIKRDYGQGYAQWYGQQLAAGADGLTNQQWANLGGAGITSQMYNSYVNQNRDEYNNGLNYGMNQIRDSKKEGPDPLAFLRHLIHPDALYFAFTQDVSVFLGEGYEKGVIVILRGKDKGFYSADDFGIGLGGVEFSGAVEAVALYYSGSTVTKDVFYGNRIEANFGMKALGHAGITVSYSTFPDGNFVYGKGISLGIGFSAFGLSGNINKGALLEEDQTPFRR